MGNIFEDVPPRILTFFVQAVFPLVYLLDWMWGNFWYCVEAVASVAKGGSFQDLLNKPVETTSLNDITAIGSLAPPAENSMDGVIARVRASLPDGHGIVAVDGLLLKASVVGNLAKRIQIPCDKCTMIVGPSCVATSYQVGLVVVLASRVVDDSAESHPLIPQSWEGEEKFSRKVLRCLTSFVAFATACYGVVLGGSSHIERVAVPAATALVLNFVARILLQPVRGAQVQDSPPSTDAPIPPISNEWSTAMNSPESRADDANQHSPASTHASSAAININIASSLPPIQLENGAEDVHGSGVVSCRENLKTVREFVCQLLPGVFYGISGLGSWTSWISWISWISLALGVVSNAVFSTSGGIYSPLTGWLSGLILPLFVVAWIVFIAIAVAFSPLTFWFLVVMLVGAGCCENGRCCICATTCSTVKLLFHSCLIRTCVTCPLIAWSILGVVLSGLALAGKCPTSDWVLYVSWVGWVPGFVFTLALEYALLGKLDLAKAVKNVEKDWRQRLAAECADGNGINLSPKCHQGVHSSGNRADPPIFADGDAPVEHVEELDAWFERST